MLFGELHRSIPELVGTTGDRVAEVGEDRGPVEAGRVGRLVVDLELLRRRRGRNVLFLASATNVVVGRCGLVFARRLLIGGDRLGGVVGGRCNDDGDGSDQNRYDSGDGESFLHRMLL